MQGPLRSQLHTENYKTKLRRRNYTNRFTTKKKLTFESAFSRTEFYTAPIIKIRQGHCENKASYWVKFVQKHQSTIWKEYNALENKNER